MYNWSRITVVQRRPQKPLNATSQHLNFKKFPGGACPQTPLELGRVAASCLLLWSGPGITDILATPLGIIGNPSQKNETMKSGNLGHPKMHETEASV